MAHSTTPRLRNQILRLHRQEALDLDFGLGEILPAEDRDAILEEEGATWKQFLYTPVLTVWAFLWQVLSPDRSCRVAVKRVAAWLASRGRLLKVVPGLPSHAQGRMGRVARWSWSIRPTRPSFARVRGVLFEHLSLSERWVSCDCGMSLDRDHSPAVSPCPARRSSRSRMWASRMSLR
jgi:hypothetical protein